MPFKPSKPLLQKARRQRYAVGAFNFCAIEALQGIVSAAAKMRAPVIISTSEGEAGHVGMRSAAALVQAAAGSPKAKKAKIPMALHLDHGKSIAGIKAAINAGYSSVHIDGSKLNFGRNVKLTKKAAVLAHRRGVSVEGELGHIFGASRAHGKAISAAARRELYTDPEQAKEFAQKTGIDSMAVAIGSAHGIWKTSPKLDFPRLRQIAKLTRLPIVLHGGSGIPAAQVRKAISLGVAKINVNTELRIAYTNSLRRALLMDVDEATPYKYLSGTAGAVQKVVEKKMALFRAKGKAR